MRYLKEKADLWDIEYNEKELKALGSKRKIYSELCKSVDILKKFKFEPYQPVQSPPEPDYLSRLKHWINQVNDEDEKYMLYLSSKIIFFTQSHMDYLMKHIFERKISKIITEDIILNHGFAQFSYNKAKRHFATELEKTLFVGLSDSSRINDFCHKNMDIDRSTSTGFDLQQLLYPFTLVPSDKITEQSISEIKKEFLSEPLLEGKDRLVILEDFSGSGSDILETLEKISPSNLPFNEIIFAPYIITYKACENLDNWIKDKLDSRGADGADDREYYYTYGTLIPKEVKCFDYAESYLKDGWHDSSIDICDKVKNICESKMKPHLPPDLIYGYGNLKVAVVTYYNCPDNSLPIIYYDNDSLNLNPLFKRASRIL